MDDTITTIYCLCDDLLKAIFHRRDDPRVRLTTAEVMTIPLVAATFFGGNIERACGFLKEYGYMPGMIGKSHLNRRSHAIEPGLWRALFFSMLADVFERRSAQGGASYYAVDSLPVAACDNSSVSAVAGSIPPKGTGERSAATSRASGATSTVCGCIWWSRKRASRWSLLWRRARKQT